jgi:hypothetical protein
MGAFGLLFCYKKIHRKETMRLKAFYGSRFSPNMTRTPEGYLICHNVPIARTGWYSYLGQEIGLEDLYNQKVDVYRSPEEVFSLAAIASFEGKSVTDNHPSEDVRPDNYSAYEKGHITNVRRGSGEYDDCLVADLVIKDPILISQVEAGKREVSNGYNCIYEEMNEGYTKKLRKMDGRKTGKEEIPAYQQKQICGNHVAVVNNGRAGDRIAIHDSKENILKLERSKKMKTSIMARMFKAFAKDAEPDEIQEAMDAMNAPAPQTPAPVVDTTPAQEAVNPMEERLAKLEAIIAQLVKTDEEVHASPLDALEAELETPAEQAKEDELGNEMHDAMNEESVTVPVESMDAENPFAEKETTTDSKAALLKMVRDMKPIVAGIKDPAERRRMSDALATTLRGNMPVKTADANKGYAGIMKASQAHVQKTNDSAEKSQNAASEYKKMCDERNPHKRSVK